VEEFLYLVITEVLKMLNIKIIIKERYMLKKRKKITIFIIIYKLSYWIFKVIFRKEKFYCWKYRIIKHV